MLIILPFAAFALQMTREMTVNVIMQRQRREREKQGRKVLEKHERWTASGAMSCQTSKKTARRLERTQVMSSLSQLPLQLSLSLSLPLLSLPLPSSPYAERCA